uniref:Tetratricopeptide repeat protein 24 n=1 Tax=Anser cygnoides TaxID=8845 RepID=A0A8B9EYB9_ANSCY
MGCCYLGMREPARAARCFLEAARSYAVAESPEAAAVALSRASGSMLQSRRFGAAEIARILTWCRSLCDSIADPALRGKLYNEVGLGFSQLHVFSLASESFERALALCQGTLGRRGEAALLQNLGAARNALRSFSTALGLHRRAAALHGAVGNRRAQGQCFGNLAYAFSQLGNHEAAAENYLHALQAFRDSGHPQGGRRADRQPAHPRPPAPALPPPPPLTLGCPGAGPSGRKLGTSHTSLRWEHSLGFQEQQPRPATPQRSPRPLAGTRPAPRRMRMAPAHLRGVAASPTLTGTRTAPVRGREVRAEAKPEPPCPQPLSPRHVSQGTASTNRGGRAPRSGRCCAGPRAGVFGRYLGTAAPCNAHVPPPPQNHSRHPGAEVRHRGTHPKPWPRGRGGGSPVGAGGPTNPPVAPTLHPRPVPRRIWGPGRGSGMPSRICSLL